MIEDYNQTHIVHDFTWNKLIITYVPTKNGTPSLYGLIGKKYRSVLQSRNQILMILYIDICIFVQTFFYFGRFELIILVKPETLKACSNTTSYCET